MEVTARVSCRPTPKGNAEKMIRRRGRRYRVPADHVQAAQDELVLLLSPHAPRVPLAGPVSLRADIYHPIPKSWPAWRQKAAAAGVVTPCGRGTPDIGNVEKMLCDAMQKAKWLADDAQVCEQLLLAYYSTKPGYRLRLSTMEGRCSPDTLREDIPPLPRAGRVYFSPSDSELTPAG